MSYLPENAPFNSAQRMWLDGFFAGLGLHGSDSSPSVEEAPGEPLAILWGSQTGTAESYAKKLAKKAQAAGYSPTIHDMSTIEADHLASMSSVAILTSTYGDGEPPDNAAALHSSLMAADGKLFEGMKFSVFAFGDSNYPAFCQCGKDFDSKLEALGATRVAPRIEGDCDFDEPFSRWSTAFFEAMTAA